MSDKMTAYTKIQPYITTFIFVAFNVLRIVGSFFDYMDFDIGVAERLYLDLNLAGEFSLFKPQK